MERRKKVTREGRGRGEMKPTHGSFRAVLSAAVEALRLELAASLLGGSLLRMVSQGLCCHSENPRAPDVPCGQVHKTKVSTPWVVMSEQQSEDAAAPVNAVSR